MKFFITVFIAVAISSVAVFGVFAMNVGSHDAGHSRCLAEAINNSLCPENNALGAINFHFQAFQNFSSVIFGLDQAQLALLLLLTLFLASRILKRFFYSSLSFLTSRPSYFFQSKDFFFFKDFTAWLAFHENSPNLI